MQDIAVIGPSRIPAKTDQSLYRAAQELEAGFLSEMLKSAGLGAARDAFGGGQGEQQFQSFLIHEQARQLVGAGGIGLAEAIFQAMKDQNHDR